MGTPHRNQIARDASKWGPSPHADRGRQMRIESVNVGMPREVLWHGRPVTTGIFKTAVNGSIAVRRLNLEGDGQADLTVHGGRDKAIYCYSTNHYGYWRRKLAGP